MQYIVKCPFCDNTYSVNNQHMTSMQCPTCGAQNTIKDVIQQVESDEERAERIRNENRYQYQSHQTGQQRNNKSKNMSILVPLIAGIVLAGSCLLSAIFSVIPEMIDTTEQIAQELKWDEKEENIPVVEVSRNFTEALKTEDYAKIKECLYLPEGSYISDEEIETLVKNNIDASYIGNSELTLSKVDFFREYGEKRRYSVYYDDKYAYQVDYRKEPETDTWKIAFQNGLLYDVEFRVASESEFMIDEVLQKASDKIYEDERENRYDLYTVPVMYRKEYKVSVKTDAGNLKRKFQVAEGEINQINIDDQANEILVSCRKYVIETWKELYKIVQDNETIDSDSIQQARQYFDDEVSDDQVRSVLENLQDLENNNPNDREYEFIVNQVEHFEAVSNDTFLCSFFVTYSNDVSKYEWGHLKMRYQDGDWKIGDPCDYSIFNGTTTVRNYY